MLIDLINSSDMWREMQDLKAENTITILGENIFIPSLPLKVRYKSGFVGKNLSLEKFASLNEEDKIWLISILEKENKDWLTKKFKELKAAWLIVIDGEVERFSSDIDKYPQEPEILEICKKRGKFPFIFVNQHLSVIEEGFSTWHPTTIINDDYYPTAKIKIRDSKSKQAIILIADFDTGAYDVFLNMERLISERLISPPSPYEQPQRSIHLGKNYSFYRRSLFMSIVSEEGESKEEVFSVLCVREWGKSPFVLINPARSSLVGRRLFQRIKVSVMLDFNKRKTKIYLKDKDTI